MRPTERGLIERLGRYNRFSEPGFHWIIPGIERMIQVNITEMMVDAEKQEIITDDNLNARVDAQIYFKVKPVENDVKASQYNVQNVRYQIVNLARTTLRNIIGTLSLKDANSKRNKINDELMTTLTTETKDWGIEVVRTELKEIDPPQDVQETMNKIVKAANEKIAAVDFATAVETRADGARRAAIKEAEGIKQATILTAEGERQAAIYGAEGEAKAFELINKSFVGNAQLLEKLKITENTLKDNTKIVLPSESELVNVIGNLSGVLPMKRTEKQR